MIINLFFFLIWKGFLFLYFIKLFSNFFSIWITYLTFYFIIISIIISIFIIKCFIKLFSKALHSDFEKLIIRSSFVNLSLFLILLNLPISLNSYIDFFCSFWTLFNSFFEIFYILASFFNPIFDNFPRLRLLSYLLRVFNNSLVDTFWGSITSLFFFAIRLCSSLVKWTSFILYQDKKEIIFFKKAIILIV